MFISLIFFKEFITFLERFYREWTNYLMIEPNYFWDPKGNMLNIKFEDSLLYDSKFRACDKNLNFYDLDYDVYYVSTLFFRDRYFEMRLFHVD